MDGDLVCPLSGRCTRRMLKPGEEEQQNKMEQQEIQPEDLDDGPGALARWYQTGYDMTDKEAKDFFGTGGGGGSSSSFCGTSSSFGFCGIGRRTGTQKLGR